MCGRQRSCRHHKKCSHQAQLPWGFWQCTHAPLSFLISVSGSDPWGTMQDPASCSWQKVHSVSGSQKSVCLFGTGPRGVFRAWRSAVVSIRWPLRASRGSRWAGPKLGGGGLSCFLMLSNSHSSFQSLLLLHRNFPQDACKNYEQKKNSWVSLNPRSLYDSVSV